MSLVSDTFDDVVKRGWYATQDQFIVSCLEHPDVERVVVVDAPRGVVARVYRGVRGRSTRAVPDGVTRVRPLIARRTPDVSEASLTRRYRSMNRQIGLALRRLKVHRPALVAFNTWHAAAGRPAWARTAVFYAQDDESAIAHIVARRADVRRAYASIASSDMPVFTVTDELARRIGVPDRAVTVPNGIDPALWRDLTATVSSRAVPMVTYVGTVDNRLDVDAFVALAAAGFDVRISGPPRDPAVVARLRGFAGVTVGGVLSRPEVVALLSSSDAVLLAHRATPLTQAMSPLKLFEYVASGRPVVATDLAGMHGQHPSVLLVPPGGDYVTAVREALTRGPMPESERLAAVDALSWRNRHRPVFEALSVGAMA